MTSLFFRLLSPITGSGLVGRKPPIMALDVYLDMTVEKSHELMFAPMAWEIEDTVPGGVQLVSLGPCWVYQSSVSFKSEKAIESESSISRGPSTHFAWRQWEVEHLPLLVYILFLFLFLVNSVTDGYIHSTCIDF